MSEKIISSAPTMKASTIDAIVINTSDHGMTRRRLRGSGLMRHLLATGLHGGVLLGLRGRGRAR